MFYLGRHNEATFENSTVIRLHPVVLPNFLGWFGIDRSPSFPLSPAYSAVAVPEVGSGIYDHVGVRMSLRSCHDRLTCARAFRCDPSYKRTTLSLVTWTVAPGQRRLLSADFALPDLPFGPYVRDCASRTPVANRSW